ncbi:hypothetical protein V6N12_068975 [Hibiscus sabdariffa]|uniref:Uncharacterized protein n=1 Tax=Hibiscus sabdariffa TaxID=183260 RepID=A0ABR2CAB7_9ROSI
METPEAWFPSYQPLKPTLSLSIYQTPLKPCSFVVLKEWSSSFKRHCLSSRGVGLVREYGWRRAATGRRFGCNGRWCDLAKPSSASGCGSLGDSNLLEVSLTSCIFLGCDKDLDCFTILDKKQTFGYLETYVNVNVMRNVDGDISLEEAYSLVPDFSSLKHCYPIRFNFLVILFRRTTSIDAGMKLQEDCSGEEGRILRAFVSLYYDIRTWMSSFLTILEMFFWSEETAWNYGKNCFTALSSGFRGFCLLLSWFLTLLV